ncbi:MAG TPA: hypothetical protein VLM40_15385, partial [Gemmata sp.]|nr:hypothetical protein [Gemmata sp.]
RSIEELVADLGHPAFSTREKAQQELWERGDAAIPALEKALHNDDPEIVRRAGELLAKFAWGIRSDTPPAVLKLLRKYQAGDRDPAKSAKVRETAIDELMHQGPPGIGVVKSILGKQLSDATRSQLTSQIIRVLHREVPLLLFEGKVEGAAELMELHAAGTGPEGAADYAAFQVLLNRLPAAIANAEAAVNTARRVADHKLILAHLYRAAGDWPRACNVARDISQPEGSANLLHLLHEDAGDWSALADTYPTVGANHPEGLHLAFLRLAGRHVEFEKEVQGLLKASQEFNSAEQTFQIAVGLLANNRAEDATRLLLEKKQNLGLLGEVLISRLRFKDALNLIGSQDKQEQPLSLQEKLEFDVRRARVLVIIGHRSDAVQLFNKVAEGLKRQARYADSASPITAIRSLLRTEMGLGLKDLAIEHAATFVATGIFARHNHSYTGESAFELLFNEDATVAETIFNAIRVKDAPSPASGPTLFLTRDLLLGKASKLAVDDVIKAIREDVEIFSTEGTRIDPHTRVPSRAFQCRQQLAIAAVSSAARRDATAETAYKSAAELTSDDCKLEGARSWVFGTTNGYLPYVQWGDFLFDRDRFHEAAMRYLEGWKKFPNQPLLLFLSGRALAQAGAKEEGEKRMALSHWISLGQERVRGRFLDELIRRGEGKAVRRETELLLRACWCRDHYFGNVMNQAARASVLVKDFATAEKTGLRSNLVMLKTPGMYYVDPAAYLNAPHSIHTYRARARLAEGKLDEAVKLARAALAITPGNIDLVAGIVPTLEQRGRTADADEIFRIAWKAYHGVLKDFPDSPWARGALASLAADCRRELDAGLTFAREAVKADPGYPPFREALAEVLFRRGDRKEATEVMTKLLADNPRNVRYKRQLWRYQHGAIDDPKADTVD